MLKVRIIPTLLWKDLGLVKGVAFDSWRRVGTIMPAVKVYNTRQVDELIVLDISATSEGRLPDFDEVRGFSSECFVPLTVGGGIRSIEDIKQLLRAGADKVSINTAAFERPELVSEAAELFGSQCVVVSIDARRNPDGSSCCLSRSGRQESAWEPGDWAQEMERRGAGEILITSVERDGTLEGYDLELIRRVSSRVRIPVIASGGAGNYQHLFEALDTGGAAAVAAASMFHFTEQTPLEARNYLAARGIPVRNAGVRK
jgi:imidazole glycerol-phosphate synthase subunit HisF